MFVKMKETRKGCDRSAGGVAMPMQEYEKGETYKVSKVLGKCFLDGKVAVETDELPTEKDKEEVTQRGAKGRRTKG